MVSGYDRFLRALEWERARSKRLVPLAKTAEDLLSEEKPFFECRDGTKLMVERRDLERVASMVEYRTKGLSLPIFIKPAPSMGHGFYQLLGVETGSEMERAHKSVVFGLLGQEARDYLYSYEVQRLKREIPSLIHIFY